jgi:hypothetical protein
MSYYTLGIFLLAVFIISLLGMQNASNRILKMVLSEYEWTIYTLSLKRLIPGYPIYRHYKWKKQIKKEENKKLGD